MTHLAAVLHAIGEGHNAMAIEHVVRCDGREVREMKTSADAFCRAILAVANVVPDYSNYLVAYVNGTVTIDVELMTMTHIAGMRQAVRARARKRMCIFFLMPPEFKKFSPHHVSYRSLNDLESEIRLMLHEMRGGNVLVVCLSRVGVIDADAIGRIPVPARVSVFMAPMPISTKENPTRVYERWAGLIIFNDPMKAILFVGEGTPDVISRGDPSVVLGNEPFLEKGKFGKSNGERWVRAVAKVIKRHSKLDISQFTGMLGYGEEGERVHSMAAALRGS